MSVFYSCILIFFGLLFWAMIEDFFMSSSTLNDEPISKEEYDKRKREESYVGPYDPLMGDKKEEE